MNWYKKSQLIRRLEVVPPYHEDICPVCNIKASGGCKCPMRNGITNDRHCPNGHTWYYNNKELVMGSHH